MPMSILAMEMLMHYHSFVEEFENIEWPAQQECLRWALSESLLVQRAERGQQGSSYNTTPRAQHLIEAWRNTPLPVQVWVIPAVPA